MTITVDKISAWELFSLGLKKGREPIQLRLIYSKSEGYFLTYNNIHLKILINNTDTIEAGLYFKSATNGEYQFYFGTEPIEIERVTELPIDIEYVKEQIKEEIIEDIEVKPKIDFLSNMFIILLTTIYFLILISLLIMVGVILYGLYKVIV
jgi:hypothetical protein